MSQRQVHIALRSIPAPERYAYARARVVTHVNADQRFLLCRLIEAWKANA